MTPEKTLLQTKIDLMTSSPFLATIALQMTHELVDQEDLPLGTMACTNGLWCKYSKELFMSWSREERLGVIKHEVWHIAFMHQVRLSLIHI